MKKFFLRKKLDRFSYFLTFKNVLTFLQNLNLGGKKTFLKHNIIWYTFYIKFATFTDFEKMQVFSRKNANCVRICEIILFQSHSRANLLQFGDKNFRIKIKNHRKFGYFQLASKRLKKKKRSCWMDDFPSIFDYGRKIISLENDQTENEKNLHIWKHSEL